MDDQRADREGGSSLNIRLAVVDGLFGITGPLAVWLGKIESNYWQVDCGIAQMIAAAVIAVWVYRSKK